MLLAMETEEEVVEPHASHPTGPWIRDLGGMLDLVISRGRWAVDGYGRYGREAPRACGTAGSSRSAAEA